MGKGADFERSFCKDLSLWWTSGERDDVFWRTSISGGRASVRAKKQLNTAGGCGDVTAVDPVGAPLVAVATIELKKGYGKRGTAFDSLDNLPRGKNPIKPCQWEEFVAQARRDSDLSGAPYWMLVHSRPSRAPMVFVPYALAARLDVLKRCEPFAVVSLPGTVVFATTWARFKAATTPDDFRAIHSQLVACWRPGGVADTKSAFHARSRIRVKRVVP